MKRTADERGQVGGVEALLFGVLVFVAGSLLLGTSWAVLDTKFAAQAAAREAVRSWVESDGSDEAWLDAERRAVEAFTGHGRSAEVLTITKPASSFGRCAPVTVSVHADLVVPGIPLIGRATRHVEVRASHTEVVDPYRSGLAAGAGCATP